jgi:hypothetical protein
MYVMFMKVIIIQRLEIYQMRDTTFYALMIPRKKIVKNGWLAKLELHILLYQEKRQPGM